MLEPTRTPPAAAFVAMLLSLSLFSGCVTTAKGRQMQRDILALQAQFDELRSEKEKLKATLAKASKEMVKFEDTSRKADEIFRRLSANFGVEVDTVRSEIQKLTGAREEALHAIAALRKDLDAVKEELAAAKPRGPTPLPTTPDELYSYAYARQQAMELDEALRAFRAYARTFPDDKRADNAIFFAGDILFSQGKLEDAVVTLQEILTVYAAGDKVDDATFRMGEAFEALGKCQEAHVFYGELVKQHKKSPHAKSAKDKLKEKCK